MPYDYDPKPWMKGLRKAWAMRGKKHSKRRSYDPAPKKHRAKQGYYGPSGGRYWTGPTGIRRYDPTTRAVRNAKSFFSKLIAPIVGIGTFFQQVTEHDFQVASNQNIWSHPETQGALYRAKFLAQHVVFRLTGQRLWKDVWLVIPENQGVKINPWGWANKWTGLGSLFTILGFVPRMPGKTNFRKIGVGMLAGGFGGGLLDQADDKKQTSTPTHSVSQTVTASIWGR